MRTIQRYEPSDITPDNQLHVAVMAGLTLAFAELVVPPGHTADAIEQLKSATASFLNVLLDMGIDVRPEVPEAFRNSFGDEP